MEVKETKEDEQEEIKKVEKFKSIIDKVYETVNSEIKLTEQRSNYDEVKKKIKDIFGKDSNLLSDTQMITCYYSNFSPDCDKATLEKPDWFDEEKFQKGQQFAQDHFAGLFLSQLYSLFCLLCNQDGLEILIMTQQSHTPYLAFKRYLSTAQRVRNWYNEDPWCKGTRAYKDILMVRKMHLNVRTKIVKLDREKIKTASTINHPYCPVFQYMIDDFSKLPKDSLKDYWYENRILRITDSSSKPIIRNINQMDMSYTLFGFMGFPILFPRQFGIDKYEGLENLCYFWKCIGHLLGVDDEINICRGSLEDVKNRCREYVEEMVKPAFRRLTPQWEHMMRCIIEGQNYILAGTSFEMIVLHIAEMLEIQMPSLYSSLSYFRKIQFYLFKYFLRYAMKLKFIRNFANKSLNLNLNKALNFDQAKLDELKKISMSSPLHVSVGEEGYDNIKFKLSTKKINVNNSNI